jgi:hypothetical protein
MASTPLIDLINNDIRSPCVADADTVSIERVRRAHFDPHIRTSKFVIFISLRDVVT